MTLEPISQYGWTLDGITLKVLWDTLENLKTVRDRVHVLLKVSVKAAAKKELHTVQKAASASTAEMSQYMYL